MIGIAEQNEDGSPLLDEQGQERVVIIGGKGDQGLKKVITYLRRRALPKATVVASKASSESSNVPDTTS